MLTMQVPNHTPARKPGTRSRRRRRANARAPVAYANARCASGTASVGTPQVADSSAQMAMARSRPGTVSSRQPSAGLGRTSSATAATARNASVSGPHAVG